VSFGSLPLVARLLDKPAVALKILQDKKRPWGGSVFLKQSFGKVRSQAGAWERGIEV